MRFSRLLFVLALAVITVTSVFAQDNGTDRQSPNPQQNVVKRTPTDITPPANSGEMQSFDFTNNGVPFRIQLKVEPKMQQMMQDYAAQMQGCYVMHTIQVVRDSKDSDSTHVVNVTNCTPAKRFEMKSAVATPQQK